MIVSEVKDGNSEEDEILSASSLHDSLLDREINFSNYFKFCME